MRMRKKLLCVYPLLTIFLTCFFGEGMAFSQANCSGSCVEVIQTHGPIPLGVYCVAGSSSADPITIMNPSGGLGRIPASKTRSASCTGGGSGSGGGSVGDSSGGGTIPGPGPVLSGSTIKAVDKIFVDSSVDMACIRNQGFEAFIVGYMPGVETQISNALRLVEQAGMIPSAYFSISGNRDTAHISDFLSQLRSANVRTVFLDIENRVPQIDSIANQWYQAVCVEAGYTCGIYTNHGGMSAANFPHNYVTPLEQMYLWYAQWDTTPNPRVLDSNFYGWNESQGHQYRNGYMCGTKLDFNVFASEVFM